MNTILLAIIAAILFIQLASSQMELEKLTPGDRFGVLLLTLVACLVLAAVILGIAYIGAYVVPPLVFAIVEFIWYFLSGRL